MEGIVKGQILHPRRGGPMPAGLATGQDAEDVAAYVANSAAQPGQDTGALAQVGVGKAGGPAGRRIFTGAAGCGSCHTLSDAGTSATVGPDLDRVLANPMPRDFAARLSRDDLDALVDYLSDLTR